MMVCFSEYISPGATLTEVAVKSERGTGYVIVHNENSSIMSRNMTTVYHYFVTKVGLSNLRVEFADYPRLNADHTVVLLVIKVSQRLQGTVQPQQLEH